MNKNSFRPGLDRKERHARFALREWTNRLKGIPCFIMGCSPSISEINCSLLTDYFTIGINRSYRLLDPTVLLWQDISFWKTESEHLLGLKALKVARDIADPKRLFYNFYLKSADKYKFDNKTWILQGCGNSAGITAEFAVALGCNPIILLGVDCQVQGENTDFFGVNKFWTPYTIPNCLKALQFIKNECPVPVLNCGRSPLWEYHSLPEAIKIADPNKIYNLGREAYVARLLDTVRF